MAQGRRLRLDRRECNARLGGDGEILLAAPLTYMNRSGHAARCLMERYGLEPGELLVVYDDVNLPLGRLRLRLSGGPGGHLGMQSIIHQLRTEAIPRLRLGVAGGKLPAGDLADFVLSPFRHDELPVVEELIGRAAEACEAYLREGGEAAMNRFNG